MFVLNKKLFFVFILKELAFLSLLKKLVFLMLAAGYCCESCG